MRKGFVSNIVFLLVLNLLIKPFWIFGIDRHVQNILGEEIYGQYFSLLGFTYMFHILLDFGLQYYNSRNISAYPHMRQKYFSHTINLKVLLGTAYFIFSILAALGIGYGKVEMEMLIWLMINQALVSMIFFMRSNLSGSLKFIQDSVISILDKLLMIIICVLLIWSRFGPDEFNIMHFIYAQTIAYIFTLFVVIQLVSKIDIKYHFSFRIKYYLVLMRRAMPYALAVFLMTVYSRIDAVMLERILGSKGDYYAGVYAQSFRIMDAANMIGLLMSGILLPVFARLLNHKRRLSKIVEIAFLLIMVLSLPIGLSMVFFNAEIIMWLYPSATVVSAEVLFYLGIAHLLFAGIYVVGTLLTAAEKFKTLNLLFAVGVLLNIILNIFFIRENLAVGAAQATVLTQLIIFVGEIYLIFRFRIISVSKLALARLLTFIIVLVILAFLLAGMTFPILLKLMAIGSSSIILALTLALLNKSDFKELLPTERL